MTTDRRLPVYLYAPNLVGYARILLAAIACVYMPTKPMLTCVLYTISCLLDAVDGHLARMLNQCSKFGAVLDMVTDRSTTTCLICHLILMYPQWTIMFQFIVALDFTSHYMQMFASLVSGKDSHKKMNTDEIWLLRLYYENNKLLFFLCAANELFLLVLYLLSFDSLVLSWGHQLKLSAYLIMPFWALKQLMNLIQLISASKRLLAHDAMLVDKKQ